MQDIEMDRVTYLDICILKMSYFEANFYLKLNETQKRHGK
jgi:hypothetical protein